ncbi:MAG TPA: hypothetical protein VF203_04460 [Burkholderiales bacterium]
MRARILLPSLALLLVAACQSYQGDVGSPYYVVPAGTRLALNQPLSFAPGQVSLHVQNGRVVPMNQVRAYDPFCKFELYTRIEAARTVQPHEITVTGARQYRFDGNYSALDGLQLAGLSFGLYAQAGGEPEGGVPVFSYLTRMDLQSPAEPDVYRLTCLRWSYPGMAEHVSIAEIRQTLSPLFTLRLPAGR